MSVPFAGLSPASAYVLTGEFDPQQPVAILADMIDPATGDFASLEDSASIADGMAVVALTIQRGTGAAVLNTGHRLRDITHVDNDAGITAESLVREAFAPARAAGVLELVRVASDADAGDGAQINSFVEYTDLLLPPGTEATRKAFAP